MKTYSKIILVVFLLSLPYIIISVLSGMFNPIHWDDFFLLWFIALTLLCGIISAIIVSFQLLLETILNKSK